MVHGDCKSAGCYAMTDALMEEIYALAREAFAGGQKAFEVHAFPFRMTSKNMSRHRRNEHYAFWRTLKQGYDYFETYRLTPTVAVCERRYVVNVKLPANSSIRADRTCPRFRRPIVEPFTPKPYEQQLAWERIKVPGPKFVWGRTRLASSLHAPRPTVDIEGLSNRWLAADAAHGFR
jgi:murein L,D-transpeptidase YafK